MKKQIIVFLIISLILICAFSALACKSGNKNEDNWGEWTVVSSPSCTDNGTEVRISKSDSTVFETRVYAAAYGHDYDEWEESFAPTCLIAGIETSICKICGNYDYQAIPALGHDWDEWILIESPTCLTGGYETKTCKNDPTHTDMQIIDALGHDWSGWIVTTVPTVLSAGTETRYCKHDNKHIETRAIPALEHDWSDWVVTTAPTCLSAGTETRICRNTNNIETRSISAPGHDWNAWTATLVPTCTSTGVETRICKHNSGHIEMRAVPSLEHDWNDWTVTTAPTCLSAGTETRICKNDYTHILTRSITKLGHDWGDWVMTTPPTETTDGTETRICKNDNTHIETRIAIGTALGSDVFTFTPISGTNECQVRLKTSASGTVYVPVYHDGMLVTRIVLAGFSSTPNLEKVVFLNGSKIREIPASTFQNCPNLKSIEIPASVISIGTNAFALCDNLKDVTFESGSQLESIGVTAFRTRSGKKSLIENMELPASVNYIAPNAFLYCKNLNLVISSENEVYKVDGNCLIEKATNTIIFAFNNSIIPDYVTDIGMSAFSDNNNLSIEISANVMTIGKGAFTHWTDSQTIYVKGFASEAEADLAWGASWRTICNAVIVYQG